MIKPAAVRRSQGSKPVEKAKSESQIDIDEIIERYPGKPEYLIFLLQDIQEAFNYISAEAMSLVCDHTGVPLSRANAVATFYQSFSLEPKGEHEVLVCTGTACHLKGAPRLVEHLERRLNIKVGQTTPDQKITLDVVSCPGCCSLGPVVMSDERYTGWANAVKLDNIIKDLYAK